MAQAPSAPAQMTMRDYVTQQATKLGIAPSLALAIIDQESAGAHSSDAGLTTSSAGARGFMQLMPATARGLRKDPTNPFENIDGGLDYFKQQLDRYKGDVRLALAAYNAGPGNVVDRVPDIPETQDYVQKILGKWQASEAAPAQVITAPPAGRPARMISPAGAERQPKQLPGVIERAGQVVGDVAGGVRAGLAQTIYGGGDLIRRATGMERIVDQPDVQAAMTPPASTAGKVGEFVEGAAEFAVPGRAISMTVKEAGIVNALMRAGVRPFRAAMAVAGIEGAAQAAPAAAIASLHGDDPTAAAVISAAAPLVGTYITEMAPAIRKAATTRMARFMERGMRGDITPELQRKLAQAANDFIDLPLQRTWRQTAQLTRGGRQQAGKDLAAGLAGPLGDTPVPIAPIFSALDDFEQEFQHIIPMRDLAGDLTGEFRTKAFNADVPRAVSELKNFLAEYADAYGTHIPARQLHDVKEVWWKAIYPRKEAAQPVSSTYELLTSAQREARMRGAKAIAQVLETDAPSIAALDSAVSHAATLDQFVKRLATKARGGTLAKPEARYAIGAVGGATGLAAGGAIGHPFIGAHIGYATARLLLRAIESPKWRLQPIAMRRRLADALATGAADTARKLITPLALETTAAEDNLLSPENQRLRASNAAMSSSTVR